MKISVIIPVYNTEEYIDDCLSSVIKQSYTDLEILVINDYSSDCSMDIVKKYADQDSRIRLIELNQHSGVGYARNVGIDQSTGDYLYFVDSDDFLHHNAIKLLVDELSEDDRIISGTVSTVKSLDEADEFVEEDVPVTTKKTADIFPSRTIQKVLFSKTFILEHDIRFLENVSIYSDYAFVYKVISLVSYTKYVRDSRYFRRKRLNLIEKPNIIETSNEEKSRNYMKMYLAVEAEYHHFRPMKYLIDIDFMNFYRKTFLNYMRERESLEEMLNLLELSANQLSDRIYNDQNLLIKQELKAIKLSQSSRFIQFIRLHHMISDVKQGANGFTHLRKLIYNRLFRKLSKKSHYVVFESFMGKSYSGNPKAIYEYMLKQKPGYTFIWVNNGTTLNIPGNPKQVNRFSLAYYYYMARSKYWVLNTRLPKHVKKDTGTVYLQTWHGTPLKRLGLDIEEVQMPGTDTGRYKKNFSLESNKWDYLISPNQYSSDIFTRAFDYDNELLEFGYPRNDVLYQADKQDINQIKRKAGIPLDKKVILYAPTWRDDQFISKGKYKFELPLDLQQMREALSDEYVLVLRLHYLVANQLDLTGYEDFAYDLSLYDDISELYLISDLLVTDYSSVFFDFANLKRPILFYTYDLDDYKGKVRGLYFDIETEVPSPLLMTTNEVVDAIKNIDDINRRYADIYESFYQRFCQWEDGEASRNVVQKVFGNN